MVRKRRSANRLISQITIALAAVLAFGAIAAGSAQAEWKVGGKSFSELGISEATFESSGTFEVEWPGFNLLITCSEPTWGTLSSSGFKEQHVEPTACKVAKPVSLEDDCKVWYDPFTVKTDASGVTNTVMGFLEHTESYPGKGCTLSKQTGYLNAERRYFETKGATAVELPYSREGRTKFGAQQIKH